MSTENKSKCIDEISNNEEEILDSSYEINTWDELDIEPNLLRGIYSYGFERPSNIQKKQLNLLWQVKM